MIVEKEVLWKDLKIGDVIISNPTIHYGISKSFLQVIELPHKLSDASIVLGEVLEKLYKVDGQTSIRCKQVTPHGFGCVVVRRAYADSRCDIVVGGIEAARQQLLLQEM